MDLQWICDPARDPVWIRFWSAAVPQSTTKYYKVLQSATKYYKVPQSTSDHCFPACVDLSQQVFALPATTALAGLMAGLMASLMFGIVAGLVAGRPALWPTLSPPLLPASGRLYSQSEPTSQPTHHNHSEPTRTNQNQPTRANQNFLPSPPLLPENKKK